MSFKSENVVLIHGLWSSGWLMLPLAWRLGRCGYKVSRFTYVAANHALREHAACLHRYCQSLDVDALHFVGHSLGGLVIRALFHYFPEQRRGRIVTLGTPHAGNYVAAKLVETRFGRSFIGRGMRELVEGRAGGWAPPQRDVGVIAGSLGIGIGRVLVSGLPVPNDGTVAVAETRFAGARDHLVLPVTHTGMLFSAQVADQVCCFLRNGRFCRT